MLVENHGDLVDRVVGQDGADSRGTSERSTNPIPTRGIPSQEGAGKFLSEDAGVDPHAAAGAQQSALWDPDLVQDWDNHRSAP
jgi:hypothetical protein